MNGEGDFRSIREALNSLPSDSKNPVIILIRNGIYKEKVFIQRGYLTLVGEDRDSTRIVFPELRENWNKANNGSDWGAGVVNIDSNSTDVTIANLTVYNNYGWQHQVFNKHQFAIRGAGTRIILLYCNVISDGGDALSLWNKQNGMYYHADCFFEGWVDFVCPRGWCYVTDSRFFGHNKSASIWHDGDTNRDQKFVVVNSRFEGVPGFALGRNHRDGQMYLLNCNFSEYMADRPIYRPETSTTPWKWGDRHYFFNCHRDGGDYAWFRDNLDMAEGSPSSRHITARWAFDGKWDPEATITSVLPFAYMGKPKDRSDNVPASDTILEWVAGRNAVAHRVFFGSSSPPQFWKEIRETKFSTGKLGRNATYYWRVDEVTDEGIVIGKTWSFTTR
jgi:pectinesterase